MQVTQTNAEGLKREYKIIVPATDMELQMTERLTEVGKTVTIPGFRPGKAPVTLLKQRYGKAIMGEVLEKILDDSARKIIEEGELRPAVQPKIEITKYDEGGDLEYDLRIEVFPEIATMDLSKLELTRYKVEPKDEDIDQVLTNISENFAESHDIDDDRPAADGDVVQIDFVGKIDGEEFQGGKAEDYELKLGSGSFIPGFEEQLVGLKAGEEKVVEVTFPEEYGVDTLAGKVAQFDVKVKALKESKPAAIDDALAEKLGMENLEALRKQVGDDQTRQYDELARIRIKRELFDQLYDGHDFPLPEQMIEQEFEAIWKQFDEARTKNPDAVDEADKNKSDDELKEDYRKLAERRVKLALLLGEVGRQNEIEVSQEEVYRQVAKTASNYPGYEQQVFEMYQKNPQALESLRPAAFEEKVVDYVLELAQITETVIPADELVAMVNEEEQAESAGAA